MDTVALEVPGWRFGLGIGLFVTAFAIWLLVPIAAALGADGTMIASMSGTIFVVNKLCLLATIAVMGRAGFNLLKASVFSYFGRYAPPRQVGPTRYRVGLVMLVAPVLAGWLWPYLVELVPPLAVHSATLAVVGDVLLLASLFVLGGEFWDKLRALFVYGASVSFPRETQGA